MALRLGRPAPWHELIAFVHWMIIGDTRERAGKPRLRINIVHFRGYDEAEHHRRPLATAIRAGKEPRFFAKSNFAQRSLGRIVAEAYAAVVEEAREGVPALEEVVQAFVRSLWRDTLARRSRVHVWSLATSGALCSWRMALR